MGSQKRRSWNKAIEAVSVQNQAAAQKLPQKMSHRNRDDKHSRGRQFEGKGRQEEEPDGKREKPGQSLQLEVPVQVQKGPHDVDAENIKMSMFSYQKEDDRL